MAEPCHDFRGVQVRPAGSRLHARIARRLGPIGTHIGILLPGLRPVIARFSAISHGAEHLCVGLLAARASRRSARPIVRRAGLAVRARALNRRPLAIPLVTSA